LYEARVRTILGATTAGLPCSPFGQGPILAVSAVLYGNQTLLVPSFRVLRGGSWLYEGRYCRAALRDSYAPWSGCDHVGFRLARVPVR
jgi:formylglycine-generating enzyme required for sulfatase activity